MCQIIRHINEDQSPFNHQLAGFFFTDEIFGSKHNFSQGILYKRIISIGLRFDKFLVLRTEIAKYNRIYVGEHLRSNS